MAAPYSIPIVIEIGKISSYLARAEYRKQQFINGQSLDPWEHALITMETDILERWYNYNPADTSLDSVRDYVYSLCGKYIPQALTILGQGTGGIIITPGGGGAANMGIYLYQVTVGASTSPAAGSTSFIIPYGDILSNSLWISQTGAGPIPRNDPSQLSFIDTYTASTALITFNQPLTVGQQFIFWAIRAKTGSSGSGGGGGTDIPTLVNGEFLSAIGGTLVWRKPTIAITSANFAGDGVTYTNTDLSGYTYQLILEDIPKLLVENVDYTVTSTGGFVITIPGFNASTNSYKITLQLTGSTA